MDDAQMLLEVPAYAVEASSAKAYVCVEDCCWETWQPGLSAEAAAYLAPPVLVGSAR